MSSPCRVRPIPRQISSFFSLSMILSVWRTISLAPPCAGIVPLRLVPSIQQELSTSRGVAHLGSVTIQRKTIDQSKLQRVDGNSRNLCMNRQNRHRSDRGDGFYKSAGAVPSREAQYRSNVPPGTAVHVVQKHHQQTGHRTAGVVGRLLTNSGFHPRGIKVMLVSGAVGRVQSIGKTDSLSTTVSSSAVKEASQSQDEVHQCRTPSGESAETERDMIVPMAVGPEKQTIGVKEPVLGVGRRRVPLPGAEPGSLHARHTNSYGRSNQSGRQARRTFRSNKVQEMSWSIEGGAVVARGETGEKLEGFDVPVDDRFDGVRQRSDRGSDVKSGGKGRRRR